MPPWCGVVWYSMVWWVCVPCYVFYGGVMHMVAVSWSACLPPLSPLVMGAAGDYPAGLEAAGRWSLGWRMVWYGSHYGN